MSRSEMKRIAVQKGEPMPTFERSLRDAAIQHMAPFVGGLVGLDYEDASLGTRAEIGLDVSILLDLLLDFLGANRQEWAKALPEIFLEQQPDRLIDTPQGKVPNLLGPGSVTNVRIVNYLVAALRGTTEEQ